MVSARADLSPSLMVRLRHLLLSMHETEQGKAALRAFGKTARFDLIPDEDTLRQAMRHMIAQLVEG